MKPIRVLQISYAMDLGGAETLIMNLYRNIDRSKVQFDFLLHCSHESAYEKEIQSLGGKIYRIPRYLGYNKLSYERDLTNFLNSHPEYLIIHDHLMNSASETLKVAKKLGRIGIAHSHIANNPFSLTELYRFFFRKDLWKIADYRFACSEEAGKRLYRNKADFIILKNGIMTEKFKYTDAMRENKRSSLGLKETTKVIGTIGRMVKQKNQVRLLYIMKRLVELNEDTKLLLIGEGPLESDLRMTTRKLNLEDKVLFTGPRTDVNELLSAMDVFVLPSLYEGLGIVLVEAQASGLPCIFSDIIPNDVDLIPELIHRVSLSASDDIWANSIQNCEQMNRRDDAWKAVADRGYDIKSSVQQLQDFYLGLSEGKCASV